MSVKQLAILLSSTKIDVDDIDVDGNEILLLSNSPEQSIVA
jgi:hypothetical protein